MLELEIKSGFNPREKLEGENAAVIQMKTIVARPFSFNVIRPKHSRDGLWPMPLGVK